jgi:hypothetical protein
LKLEILNHSGEIFGRGKSIAFEADKFYIMGKHSLISQNIQNIIVCRSFWHYLLLI